MAKVEFTDFKGEAPFFNPLQLPVTHAIKARNARLRGSKIAPLHAPVFSAASFYANPSTIFQYKNDVWFVWDKDVDAIRAPIPNDTLERVYFTGDGPPRVTDNLIAQGGAPFPSTSHRLGVPVPANIASATVVGTPTGNPTTRFYVFTYIDKYGHEGPPSSVSAKLTVEDGQTVDLTFVAAPGAPYALVSRRIYRVNAADGQAVFQKVVDIPVATLTYNDSIASGDLQEPLETEEFDEPPADMIGLSVHSTGVMAGFRNNEIMFSEPGYPNAWPVRYRMTLMDKIVGIAPLGDGWFVATQDQPYIITGSQPAAYVSSRISIPYACVSKNSIAVLGDTVVYASHHGLVRVAPGGGSQLITAELFSRAQWGAMLPASMKAFRFGDLILVIHHPRGDGAAGFIIDPHTPQDGVSTVDNIEASAGFVDEFTDNVFLSSGTNIAKFDAGEAILATWQSRPIPPPTPMPLSVVRIDAENYPILLTITRDGHMQARMMIGSPEPRRVLNSAIGRQYTVEVHTAYEVWGVTLASSMKELST